MIINLIPNCSVSLPSTKKWWNIIYPVVPSYPWGIGSRSCPTPITKFGDVQSPYKTGLSAIYEVTCPKVVLSPIVKNLSVQFSSVTQSCPTVCDPMNCSMPGSLSITSSWSSPKLKSIESVMPSNHLILCHPLLLLPATWCAGWSLNGIREKIQHPYVDVGC